METEYEIGVSTAQYEFIHKKYTGDDAGAVEAYESLKKAVQGGEGLPEKEYRRFMDSYVQTGKPPTDGLVLWEVMNLEQRKVVNEVKKSIKRNK